MGIDICAGVCFGFVVKTMPEEWREDDRLDDAIGAFNEKHRHFATRVGFAEVGDVLSGNSYYVIGCGFEFAHGPRPVTFAQPSIRKRLAWIEILDALCGELPIEPETHPRWLVFSSVS